MKKIDTAASKGFRIASRLIGYIGLGLSLLLFIFGYAMPKGFWIDGMTPYCLEFLGDWGRLDLEANENKLMTLAIVAGAILVVAVLFRITSACCKITVEEAVVEECEKVVKHAEKAVDNAEKVVEKKTGKKTDKLCEYVNGKVKEIIPEDKMPYVEKTGEFLKKYSTVIITTAATLTAVAVLNSAKNEKRRNAERRRFLRSLM